MKASVATATRYDSVACDERNFSSSEERALAPLGLSPQRSIFKERRRKRKTNHPEAVCCLLSVVKKNKNMKKHLLILFAAFATLAASAQTKVEIEGIWYNLTSETLQAEVTSSDGTEYSGSITIPATVTHNGVEYSVTSIGEWAFSGCRSLTAITIPEGVTSIGERAFYECWSLTAITIPESVTSIGERAFSRCSLKSITIPEGVTSIGDEAFQYCYLYKVINYSDLDIQKGSTDNGSVAYYAKVVYQGGELTTIGDFQFYTSDGIHSLVNYIGKDTEIVLPDSYNGESYNIGECAFSGCSSLTTITIPEGVTSIGERAFYNCSSLKSITIPEGVTSIGEYTFSGCSSLTDITIPEGVTSIGKYAFSSCSSLKSITIPEGVTSIGEYTFSGCSSLTDITIPESVTNIGEWAFYGCSSLTDITIPEGVMSIGVGAFYGCSSLTAITCNAITPPTIGGTFNEVDKSIPLYVPAGSVEAYKSASYWSEFSNIQPLKKPVTDITLSQSSATLTEGETISLTATVTPEDADDTSVTWSSSDEDVAMVSSKGKVVAMGLGTATITATANDGSGVSASCVVEVKKLILGKCATPTISYINGEIVLTCSTEGAEVKTNVTTENDNEFTGTRFEFIPTHTFTAYATKENYEKSDVATLTLCWIPYGQTTGTLNIPSKPVLISTQGGTITVSGLDAGTAVAAYSTAGTSLATATATDGTATLATNLEAGSIAIVKIGDYSIKVVIK